MCAISLSSICQDALGKCFCAKIGWGFGCEFWLYPLPIVRAECRDSYGLVDSSRDVRREVDGQGLTDSFRLTPLGLELIEKWEAAGGLLPSVSMFDRINNWRAKWIRRPF